MPGTPSQTVQFSEGVPGSRRPSQHSGERGEGRGWGRPPAASRACQPEEPRISRGLGPSQRGPPGPGMRLAVPRALTQGAESELGGGHSPCDPGEPGRRQQWGQRPGWAWPGVGAGGGPKPETLALLGTVVSAAAMGRPPPGTLAHPPRGSLVPWHPIAGATVTSCHWGAGPAWSQGRMSWALQGAGLSSHPPPAPCQVLLQRDSHTCPQMSPGAPRSAESPLGQTPELQGDLPGGSNILVLIGALGSRRRF